MHNATLQHILKDTGLSKTPVKKNWSSYHTIEESDWLKILYHFDSQIFIVIIAPANNVKSSRSDCYMYNIKIDCYSKLRDWSIHIPFE